jgi:hypothetical protein
MAGNMGYASKQFWYQQVGAPTVPLAFIARSRDWCPSTPILMLKSCHLCQIMLILSNIVIHVKSCHLCYLCQIMSFS